MAFIRPSPLLGMLRGRLGNLYIAQYGDTYVAKNMPKRRHRPPTQAQIPVRQNLVAALAYWKEVQADLGLKAIYVQAGKIRGKRAYDLAKADFLNAPVLTEIDLTGYIGQPSGTVEVAAEDDFEVQGVQVRVLELGGALIEEGEAKLDVARDRWVFVSKVSVPAGRPVVIEVTASDRPGNKAVRRVDHVCGPRA